MKKVKGKRGRPKGSKNLIKVPDSYLVNLQKTKPVDNTKFLKETMGVEIDDDMQDIISSFMQEYQDLKTFNNAFLDKYGIDIRDYL